MDVKSTWILWLKIFGLFALILGGFAYLSTVPVIFVPAMLAIVLNVILSPVVNALERRNYRRETAVLFVTACFLVALVAAFVVVPGVAMDQIEELQAKWPEAEEKVMSILENAQKYANARLPDDSQLLLVEQVPERLKAASKALIEVLPTLLTEGTIALFLIPLFTYFLLRDGRAIKKGLVKAVPNRYFEMTLSLIYNVNQQVSNYLRGVVIQMAGNAIIATTLCLAFEIPNALLIGIIAGVTVLAPVAGLLISFIVCPLIAIFSATADPQTVFWLVCLVLGLTALIDNIVIAPLTLGHSVHMHPALVIISIILGGKLFGALGIVLAVPAVSVLKVVIQEGYAGVKSNEYYIKHA